MPNDSCSFSQSFWTKHVKTKKVMAPQSLVGFWIPWAVFQIPKRRIPDSTSKDFSDSRIWIPLSEARIT